ncbi:site-specific integrase [Polaromonas sp. P2-4]|nr:site-specific integrase [Polaromonas sp. P2-4]
MKDPLTSPFGVMGGFALAVLMCVSTGDFANPSHREQQHDETVFDGARAAELLKAARTQADPLAQRDYHWMAALILTGMRIQEFSHLTVAQVRLALATGWLISRKEHCKGKEGKRRANEYCVTAQLRIHLQALMRISDEMGVTHDGLEVGQPLVWGRNLNGGASALSVRSYEARLKQWAVAAGLDNRISPHWLRHTRGMNVVAHCRGNNALKVAQLALNHASLRSTGVYVQMSRESFEREMQLVDGAGRLSKADARRLAAGARS